MTCYEWLPHSKPLHLPALLRSPRNGRWTEPADAEDVEAEVPAVFQQNKSYYSHMLGHAQEDL